MLLARWVMFCVFAVLALPTSGRADWITLTPTETVTPSPEECAAQAASAVVGTARDQLHRMNILLTRQFLQSDEYQTARLATQLASVNYQSGKQGALALLRLSPASVAAQIEIDRLEQKLDDARQESRLAGTDETAKIQTLALELLEKRSAVTHRETQVLAADENLINLRYVWIDSYAKLAALQDAFAQQLHTDPQWRSAKSQFEQARTSLASISR
jgi:hypothetical protein